MHLTIPINSDLPLTLHRQVYEQLRDQILSGHLAAGERMPSTRALAESLGISRTTVTLSYEQLISEGYLETRKGSGTYVSQTLIDGLTGPDGVETEKPFQFHLSKYGKRLRQRGEPFPAVAAVQPENQGLKQTIHFRAGRPDYSKFPMTTWRRFLLKHYRAPEHAIMDYEKDGQGYLPLREEIARYLSRSRSVRCNPSQIVIVNGSQQALDIISRVLVDRGDSVVVEDPCYQGAYRSFDSHGASLWPVPVDASGLMVARLKKSPQRKVRFVYVTPSHQFPTGYVLSLSRRLELLDWAEQNQSMIVEDDYDSEYRYAGHPLPSMQGLEPHGRVLYVGTFSKVLFPALRVGYIVAPEPLAQLFSRAKWLTDRQTPLLSQFTLADFIRNGYLERHIRRMRRLYDQRRRTLSMELKKQFGSDVRIRGENSGMHIMVSFHTDHTAEQIVKRAAQHGIELVSARPYYLKARHTNEFVLGYANLTEAQIREGIRRIAIALR